MLTPSVAKTRPIRFSTEKSHKSLPQINVEIKVMPFECDYNNYKL
jgi:hypothetical protein